MRRPYWQRFRWNAAFSVIEILTRTHIESSEVARADRFPDEMYGNALRRVKNFSTSKSRHDSLLSTSDTKKYSITSA